MTQFSYNAIDEDGKEVRGTVDAFDAGAARDALTNLGLRSITVDASPPSLPSTPEIAPPPPPPPVSPPPHATPVQKVTEAKTTTSLPSKEKKQFLPLLDTLRLYAGWLLAWYSLVVVLGYFANVRALPFDIPFVGGLFLSSLVISFLLATFFFLLCTSIIRSLHAGLILSIVMMVVGGGMFYITRVNIL
jgi:uncharacterized membrane protein